MSVAASSGRAFALVTGASEGIGRELARVFAAHGHDLFLTARRQSRLEALADEIEAAGRPRPGVFACDLAAPEGPAALVAAARAQGRVSILVNNAGYGLNGAFGEQDAGGQSNMIDLNVRALTELARLCWSDLREMRGRMLNIASVASYGPGPGMAVYYASKAYVLSLSEALWEEGRREGIVVTALCPGPVATGFQARAGVSASFSPKIFAMSAADTARAGYRALMAGRRVEIPGLANKAIATVLARFPHGLLLPRIADSQFARGGGAPERRADGAGRESRGESQ